MRYYCEGINWTPRLSRIAIKGKPSRADETRSARATNSFNRRRLRAIKSRETFSDVRYRIACPLRLWRIAVTRQAYKSAVTAATYRYTLDPAARARAIARFTLLRSLRRDPGPFVFAISIVARSLNSPRHVPCSRQYFFYSPSIRGFFNTAIRADR